jgi:hypothetical protein
MTERDRLFRDLCAQAAPHVGEPITAVGYFLRAGAADDSWRKGPDWLRRTFAPRADHPGDHLGSLNILALTPTRVVAVAGRPGAPWVRAKKPIGAWPHAAVTATAKGRTAESYVSSMGGTQRSRVIRLTLEFSTGDAPLVGDFPRDALNRECTEAVVAACG